MVGGSDEDEAYPAMLDVLERLLDSRLFDRPGASGGPV
jgi:hypothetical protein